MLSEVVCSHYIGTSSAALPISDHILSPDHCQLSPLNHNCNNQHHYSACSAAAAAAVLMATSQPASSPAAIPPTHNKPPPPPQSSGTNKDQRSHHNPVLAATGPSMSLPSPTSEAPPVAVPGSNSVNNSLATANGGIQGVKSKRTKLRPQLSLRITHLSSSQQIHSSSGSSSGLVPNPACSFDGCLPLSLSFQQQLLQKSEPLLSPNAIDELQPVEILPKLYVGTRKSAENLNLLERLNIGYVINVTTNLPNYFEDRFQIKYLRIPLEDHWSGEISTYVDDAISFINNARRSEKSCLVHCLAGRSRSVAIVLAYVMYTFGCSLDDAYDLVKKRKPGVAPGLHFLRQLHDFEKRFANPNRNTSAADGNSPRGSSGGTGTDESSGCSTPSTSLSLSSFDPTDMLSPIASATGSTFPHISPSAIPGGNGTNFINTAGSQRDRTICPSLPSVDSAFTDDQTPPAPSSQPLNVFLADDTMKTD